VKWGRGERELTPIKKEGDSKRRFCRLLGIPTAGNWKGRRRGGLRTISTLKRSFGGGGKKTSHDCGEQCTSMC